MFTSIICAVDFSEHSDRALGYAVDLAALSGGHLTIVTVVDGLLSAAAQAAGSGDTITTQTQQEIEAMFERIRAGRRELREPAGIAVLVGEPADEILKQVAECRADVIVMGTQGVGAAERFMFGSTTEKVLRESPVPVLAVPKPPST